MGSHAVSVIAQIWQKLTVETLRDEIPSMSLHMLLQLAHSGKSKVRDFQQDVSSYEA